jgi:hypothetical protein
MPPCRRKNEQRNAAHTTCRKNGDITPSKYRQIRVYWVSGSFSGQPEMLNETVSETINEHHHTAQPPLDLSVTFFQKPWENFLNPKYIPNYYIKESFGENLTPRNKTFIRSNF